MKGDTTGLEPKLNCILILPNGRRGAHQKVLLLVSWQESKSEMWMDLLFCRTYETDPKRCYNVVGMVVIVTRLLLSHHNDLPCAFRNLLHSFRMISNCVPSLSDSFPVRFFS